MFHFWAKDVQNDIDKLKFKQLNVIKTQNKMTYL